jgi:hypothetical protein
VASAARGLPCFGIDNFSQFDPGGTNKAVVLSRRELTGATNAQVLDLDYEIALGRFGELSGGRKIGLLFIDGPHDYRSQLLCILLALPWLTERAVIVIDDCNYEHVRLATRDALFVVPGLQLLFEAYTPEHPLFASPTRRESAQNGWWNGIHVLARLPGVTSPSPVPETGGAVARSVRDHIIHAHGVADFAVPLCDHAYDLAVHPSMAKLKSFVQMLRRIRVYAREARAIRSGNTRSAALPPAVRHGGRLNGAGAGATESDSRPH